MSSFDNPHRMYLFKLKNGKKKLAYGESAQDALEILALRLNEQELEQIIRDGYERINPRQLQKYVQELG
jgi:hypothetical protein